MSGHLIHVGFPKTGSTFLRRWFREHPQLTYLEGGIAGFGNVYEIARAAVASQMDVRYRVTSSESFTAPHRDTGRDHQGHDNAIDPALSQENVCGLLAQLFPNASVLIVTRGFRSMIFSSFSQYVRSGASVTLEKFVTHPLIERPWDYDRIIGLYRSAFGTEKVLVMPYELLRDDVDRFVRALEERLGLAHHAATYGRMNPALSPAEMYWYPRVNRLVEGLPIGSRLKRIYARGIFRNRFRAAAAMLQRFRPGTPVSAAAIPEQLIAAYRAKAQTLRENPLYAPYANDYYQS